MLVKILIGVIVVLGVLAAYVAMQPAEFSVSRSATSRCPRLRCSRRSTN